MQSLDEFRIRYDIATGLMMVTTRIAYECIRKDTVIANTYPFAFVLAVYT